MIEIFTNTVTRKSYDANGDLFPDGLPRIFFNGSDEVRWQLCSATPDIAEETGLKPADVWTKDTEYSQYAAIGAFLTADDDFVKRMPGTLSEAVGAGTVSSITASIPEASLATIPPSGNISLFDTDGDIEVLEYEGVAIEGTTVVFQVASGSTVENSYAQGAMMDCVQECLMQSPLDTQNSDVSTGLFVFQVTASSRKLHDALAYANTRQLDVMGLELAIFNVDTENSEVVDLERYDIDTFSIRSGIADTSMDAQVPPSRENEAVTIMKTLLAAGYAIEFSHDAENWHSEQSTTQPFDIYFRFRSAAAGGTWSSPIRLPDGTTAKVWAEGTDSEVAGLGGTHSAKGWATVMAQAASLNLVTSTAATLNPSTGNAYAWSPAADGVIEFTASELSGRYVEIPIHITLTPGSHVTGSTTSGKEVTLAQAIEGSGWYMLAWDGTTATVYSYVGIPAIDGGCIDD